MCIITGLVESLNARKAVCTEQQSTGSKFPVIGPTFPKRCMEWLDSYHSLALLVKPWFHSSPVAVPHNSWLTSYPNSSRTLNSLELPDTKDTTQTNWIRIFGVWSPNSSSF